METRITQLMRALEGSVMDVTVNRALFGEPSAEVVFKFDHASEQLKITAYGQGKAPKVEIITTVSK